MWEGSLTYRLRATQKKKLIKTKLRSRDAQESDETIKKHKNLITTNARTVVTSSGWEGTVIGMGQMEGFLEWLVKLNFLT